MMTEQLDLFPETLTEPVKPDSATVCKNTSAFDQLTELYTRYERGLLVCEDLEVHATPVVNGKLRVVISATLSEDLTK